MTDEKKSDVELLHEFLANMPCPFDEPCAVEGNDCRCKLAVMLLNSIEANLEFNRGMVAGYQSRLKGMGVEP